MNEFDETEFLLMENEHKAWLLVGKLWAEHSNDMNDSRNDRLVRAIELWGEMLAALRMHQGIEILEKACHDKQDSYVHATKQWANQVKS